VLESDGAKVTGELEWLSKTTMDESGRPSRWSASAVEKPPTAADNDVLHVDGKEVS
jgi:hypothetical protein